MIIKLNKTRGRKSHDHMAYIGPDGVGITSPGEDGHHHKVRIVINEETGEPILDESGEPIFEVEPHGTHSHERVPIEWLPEKQESMPEDKKAAKVVDLYKDRLDALADNMKRFEDDRQMYLSNQWPDAAKRKLKGKNRATHNINIIKPTIDLICGFMTENRTKRKHSPLESEDGTVAEVLDRVNYHIDNRTGYSEEEELVIEDQLQKGMGVFNLYIDTENNLEGEIMEEKYNPEDVLFGPHEKLDARDCTYAIKRKWLSVHEAKALFPHLEDKIQRGVDDPGSMGAIMTDRTEKYDEEVRKDVESISKELYDISKKNVRLLELLEVKKRSVPVIFNIDHGFYMNAERLKLQDLQQVTSIPGISEQRHSFTRVRSTKVLGTVFAEDGYMIFNSLPIRPVYCVKEGPNAYSLTHFGRDIQNMSNKAYSQYTDIMNRAAEYVWLMQRGALTKQQERKFRNNKVEPGDLIEVENIDFLKKLEGTKVPTEVLALVERYAPMMFDQMGGNSVIAGQTAQQSSTLLFREFKKQTMSGLRYLQRNLHMTKREMGKLRLQAISKIYSPSRIARLVNLESNFHITEEDIMLALEGEDLLKYDIEIIEDESAKEYKEEQFALWAELLSADASLDPFIKYSFLLELNNPPGKDKFLSMIQQAQQQEREDRMTTDESQLAASQPDSIKEMEYLKNQGNVQGVPESPYQQFGEQY